MGLAYFLGSQKDLGPLLLDDEEVGGAPASDLGLGGVLLEHSPDYREGAGLRQALEGGPGPAVCNLLRKRTLNVTDRSALKNLVLPLTGGWLGNYGPFFLPKPPSKRGTSPWLPWGAKGIMI